MVKITQYPTLPDRTPLRLLVGALTSPLPGVSFRLANLPTGPDGAPIDAVGLILVDANGNFVDITGATGGGGGGGGTALTLDPLTINETSPAGTNPPTWDWIGDDIQDGDTLELYFTTSGIAPVVGGAPSDTHTVDAREETIVWTNWPGAFGAGATVKWAMRHGRIDPTTGFMVWSPLSNVLTDVMPATALNATLMIASGDSFTSTGAGTGEAPTTGKWFGNYAAHNPTLTYENFATGGTGITGTNGLSSKISTLLATNAKWIVVDFGQNDAGNWPSQSASSWCSQYFGYLTALRAGGRQVAVCTLPPHDISYYSGQADPAGFVAGVNSWISAVNGILRASVGSQFDQLIDFAADSILGDPAQTGNLAYRSDGLHPTGAVVANTTTGQGRMTDIADGQIDAWLAGTHDVTPLPKTFVDASGAAAGATITAAPITFEHLGFGEIATVSVGNGGKHRKNATGVFVTADITVSNDDTYEVQNVASATAGGTKDTQVFVNGVLMDTFTITTTGGTPASFIYQGQASLTSGFVTRTTYASKTLPAGDYVILFTCGLDAGTPTASAVRLFTPGADPSVASPLATGTKVGTASAVEMTAWVIPRPTATVDIVIDWTAAVNTNTIMWGCATHIIPTPVDVVIRTGGFVFGPFVGDAVLDGVANGLSLAIAEIYNNSDNYTWTNSGASQLDSGTRLDGNSKFSLANLPAAAITPTFNTTSSTGDPDLLSVAFQAG